MNRGLLTQCQPSLLSSEWLALSAHGHAHRSPCVRMRAELRAISWIPWQAQIREREESSRSEFVSTVQSPRIQVRPPAEHPRTNIFANISSRSGASRSGKWGPCHAFFRQQGADWAGILSKAFLILKSNRPRSFHFTRVITVSTVYIRYYRPLSLNPDSLFRLSA